MLSNFTFNNSSTFSHILLYLFKSFLRAINFKRHYVIIIKILNISNHLWKSYTCWFNFIIINVCNKVFNSIFRNIWFFFRDKYFININAFCFEKFLIFIEITFFDIFIVKIYAFSTHSYIQESKFLIILQKNYLYLQKCYFYLLWCFFFTNKNC